MEESMEARKAFETLKFLIERAQKQAEPEERSFLDSLDPDRDQKTAQLQDLRKALQSLEKQWFQVLPDQPAGRRRGRPRRTQTGDITPQKAYQLPLLQALEEMGGRAECAMVTRRVREIMADILKPADFESLDDEHDIRWVTNVRFARQNLIERGCLRSDSPRGIWEITDRGREYLQTQTEGQLPLIH